MQAITNMIEKEMSRLWRLARSLLSRRRLASFAVVGVAGALCDLFMLVLLVEVVGLLAEIATLISIEASILLMFVLNDQWTFRAEGQSKVKAMLCRLWRSHLVRFAGISIQLGVFVVIYRGSGLSVAVSGVDWWLVWAKSVAIVIGSGCNFLLESTFTWRVQG